MSQYLYTIDRFRIEYNQLYRIRKGYEKNTKILSTIGTDIDLTMSQTDIDKNKNEQTYIIDILLYNALVSKSFSYAKWLLKNTNCKVVRNLKLLHYISNNYDFQIFAFILDNIDANTRIIFLKKFIDLQE